MFKYYELEQYEDILKKSEYEDSEYFSATNNSIYEKYVFMNDEKMLSEVEIDEQDGIDLTNVYDNVDVAETIAFIKGEDIESINANEVTYADGETVELNSVPVSLAKDVLTW